MAQRDGADGLAQGEALENWSNSADGGPDTQRPIAAPCSERRRAPRAHQVFYVELLGPNGRFRGIVVNISRSGLLLSLDENDFQLSAETRSKVDVVGNIVAHHFWKGMEIHFLGTNVSLEAQPIHVTAGHQGTEPVAYVGCRFRRALTDQECSELELQILEEEEAGSRPAWAPPEDGEVFTSFGANEAAPPPAKPVPAPEPNPEAPPRPSLEPGEGPVAPPRPSLDRGEGPRRCVIELMKVAVERSATDLHLKAGSPPRLRVDGDLTDIDRRPLSDAEAVHMVREILRAEQFERFEESGDLDTAYTLKGYARFRVNALKSRDRVGLAIRRIPEDVPSISQLRLSPLCKELADRPRGLVLVTGPTGSGKSTTLAAMLNHINRTRRCHMLTMEDPIEFLHAEIKAHITQREVGRDTHDFAAALKRALRQDPDVIMVGEMRDLETIALAVTAAETGHLVFATLHTTSAPLTVDRIVDVFPPVQQRQIRLQLADSLQGIISQTLIPKIGGGLVVAQEILVATDAVRALIREGKAPQITNVMQTGAKEGMQTLEDALNDLVARGHITHEMALSKANVRRMIRGAEDRGARRRSRLG
jgi:twitching motility protein PilT